MIRRIVVLRPHEWLNAGWTARSFAASGTDLSNNIRVQGMQFDERRHPVRVLSRLAPKGVHPDAAAFDYGKSSPQTTYAVASIFDDEEAVARLRREREQDVVGVFADPEIAAVRTVTVDDSPYCGRPPIGGVPDVIKQLGIDALHAAGLTGRNVRLAVVDSGIDGSRVPVRDGWSPIPGRGPGSWPVGHGTMCAFDGHIAAPDADLLDYALLQAGATAWTAFLSDALSAFSNLIDRLERSPGPLVVTNSWAMFSRADDAPIGTPENYSANPDHPFNQLVGSLVSAGADVLFCAGNCGQDCPDMRCPSGDAGPGKSIHGANSHPDVLTVAGVTTTDRRAGYSSQGPGGLSQRKPDIAASTHFVGSLVEAVDSGTSAATPVAAGLVAALRQHPALASIAPAQLKGLIQRTARDLSGKGWDFNLGYGVINATAALKAFGPTS